MSPVDRLAPETRPKLPKSLDPSLRIAVLVPCYNEEVAVGRVVADFRAALPMATVYVYDNCSRDRTVEVARAAGAVVRHERRQGKGFVVRRMFADIEADIYVMVDGDATYEAAAAPKMVQTLMEEGVDMVVGTRVHEAEEAYRPGHVIGNRALTGAVRVMFGQGASDMLSGYRVFSRRFVKSFPALSGGFEIETELTVHALQLDLPFAETPTRYGARLEGSTSKLSTIRDGIRIARTIARLVRLEHPLPFFSGLAGGLFVLALLLAWPLLATYVETGLVPRLPTAVLCTGLVLASLLSLSAGLVLDTVTRGRREMKLLHYLALEGPPRLEAARADVDRREAGGALTGGAERRM